MREARWLRWDRWRKALDEGESVDRSLARGAMVAGLAAVALLCLFLPVPRPGTLSLRKLLVIAGGLLFDAITVSIFMAFAASGIRFALSKGARRISGITLRATWVTAIWVPAWIFALQVPSLVTMVAGCLLMATGALYLGRDWRSSTDAAVSKIGRGENVERELLRYPSQSENEMWVRVLLPSIGLALLLEVTVTLAATRSFRWASLLAGAFVGIVIWRARNDWGGEASNKRAAAALATAFVFTLVVLLPYLRSAPFSAKIGPIPKTYSAAAMPGANTDEGWSGIILLSPRQQHKQIELPVKKERKRARVFSGKLPQAIEIPFDGAYWYFKPPDRKPRQTAHVVQGNSMKASVRSTDWYPLIMEAHQKLDVPIDLICCSEIAIVVENADRRDGPIALELWVRGKDIPDDRGYYLGTATLPLSEMPAAVRGNAVVPVEERLSYVVPSRMEGVKFDELAVNVKSPPSRWRDGAKIAIQKFVLEP